MSRGPAREPAAVRGTSAALRARSAAAIIAWSCPRSFSAPMETAHSSLRALRPRCFLWPQRHRRGHPGRLHAGIFPNGGGLPAAAAGTAQPHL